MDADVVNEPTSGERTVLPPSDMAAMLRLATFLERHTEPAGLVGPDGQMVPLPVEVYEVLVQVAEALLAGKAITVAPLEQRLTTQQAAELLGISRPTFVKLLESHESPSSSRVGIGACVWPTSWSSAIADVVAVANGLPR